MTYPKPALIDGVPMARGPVDWAYVRAVVVACVVGIVFVLSATFPIADKILGAASPLSFFYRQLACAAVGFVLLVIVSSLSPKYLTHSYFLIASGIACAVAMLLCRWGPFAGEVGGSYCWLKLSRSVSLQPSEFGRVVYVLILARLMAQPLSAQYTAERRLGYVLLAMVGFCFLLAVQQDLGMSMLVVGVTLVVLFLGGYSVWLVGALAVGLAGVGTFAAYLSPARWARITMFLHPYSDPQGAGYQACQMLATLARDGLSGSGLGMCPGKWGDLPASHTDAIFCVIGAELGIVGEILLLALIVWMAGRALKIADRAGVPTAWWLATGMGVLLGLQSLINIAVATVSVPCTGLTLPFISYGGSSLISSLMAAGIVLDVSRYRPLAEGE
jgi:cell division protein FtsW